MSETELQRQVIAAARALGWRCAHFRSVLTRGRWQTPVQGDGAGFPDLVLLRGERMIVAELKSDGKYPAPEQRKWLDAFAGVPGVETFVWRPKDWLSQAVARALL